MDERHTRRGVLRAGASAGLLAIAGCGDLLSEPSRSPTASPAATSQPTATDGGTATEPPTPPALDRLALPATAIVSKTDERVVAVDGRTFAELDAGPAGDADARVLQVGLDAVRERGGRLFVRRATYDVGPGAEHGDSSGALFLGNASGVEVVSDFARLRFRDHHPSVDIQKDLKLFGCENVRLRGLVLDGDRTNRSRATITLNVSESTGVTVRDCVLFGGRAAGMTRGYGIGLSRSHRFGLTNCVVRDAERHGIHPGGSTETRTRDYRIRNCTFLGNGVHPSGSAVDIRSHTRDGLVADCQFAGNGRAVMVKGPDVESVRVAGNVFRGNYSTRAGEREQLNLRTESGGGLVVADNRFHLDEAPAPTAHLRYDVGGDVGTVEITGNRFTGGTVATAAGGESSLETLVWSRNTVEEPRGPFADLGQVGTLVCRENRLLGRPGSETALNVSESVERGVVAGNVLRDGTLSGADRLETSHNVRL